MGGGPDLTRTSPACSEVGGDEAAAKMDHLTAPTTSADTIGKLNKSGTPGSRRTRAHRGRRSARRSSPSGPKSRRSLHEHLTHTCMHIFTSLCIACSIEPPEQNHQMTDDHRMNGTNHRMNGMNHRMRLPHNDIAKRWKVQQTNVSFSTLRLLLWRKRELAVF